MNNFLLLIYALYKGSRNAPRIVPHDRKVARDPFNANIQSFDIFHINSTSNMKMIEQKNLYMLMYKILMPLWKKLMVQLCACSLVSFTILSISTHLHIVIFLFYGSLPSCNTLSKSILMNDEHLWASIEIIYALWIISFPFTLQVFIDQN